MMMINKYDQVKSSQKKLNGIAGTSAFIIIMFLVFVIGKLYFTLGRTVDTETIVIPEQGITVNADNSGFSLMGTTESSSMAFVKHKYKIKDDSLYLWLRYALTTKRSKSGDFEIAITDNDFSAVNKIYLQGKSRDDLKLLWER